MKESAVGNKESTAVDITEKTGLTVEVQLICPQGAVNGTPNNDNVGFEIPFDRTWSTYRQRSVAGNIAGENALDAGAVFSSHDACAVGAAPDDGVERLAFGGHLAASSIPHV